MRKILFLSLFFLMGSGSGQQVIVGKHRAIQSSGTPPGSVTLASSCGANTTCSDPVATTGNAVIACAYWSNALTSPGIKLGSQTFTVGTVAYDGYFGDYGVCGYILSTSASGAQTVALTQASGSPANVEVMAAEFSCTAGTKTWHYDTANQGGSAAGTNLANTGNITTIGTYPNEAIVFAGKLSSIAATTSAPLIGTHTPTEFSWSPIGSYDHNYYLLNTQISSGAGTKTYSTSTVWVANVMALYCK